MSWPVIIEALNSSNTPRSLRVDGSDNLLVTPAGGGGFGYTGQPDESTFTEGTTPIAVLGGEYTTSPASPTSGQAAAAQITQKRALHANLRNNAGTEIGTLSNPARTDPTGSTTQPVSGTVGATIADGQDTTLGAIADAAVTTNTTGTVSGKLRGLVAILADVWSSANHWLQVSIQNATLAVTQSGSWTVTSNAGTGNFSENLAQVNGSTVATAATGVQKVGITDSTGGTLGSVLGALKVNINAAAGPLGVYPILGNYTLTTWDNTAPLNSTSNVFLQNSLINNGGGAALVQIDQTSTITGGAITFEVTFDGTNWVTIPADAVLDPTSTTYAQISLPYTLQASTNKAFLLTGKGWEGLRIKLSTQISGTGNITPNATLLAYTPAQSVIAYSPTAGNFNCTATISGTPTVAQQQTAAAPATGQVKIAVTGTAVQLPSNALKNGVIIKALSSNNAAGMTWGASSVTNTVDGTGNGDILEPGERNSAAVDNTNRIWVNGTAGDILSFVGS